MIMRKCCFMWWYPDKAFYRIESVKVFVSKLIENSQMHCGLTLCIPVMYKKVFWLLNRSLFHFALSVASQADLLIWNMIQTSRSGFLRACTIENSSLQ